ncbi:MAG: phage recombination protein Bet [Pseudomonadota bacterium]
MSEEELVRVLESSIYPGAKPESIKLVIGYCRAAQLDPMTKPVHIVPMRVKQKNPHTGKFEWVWRDVVMPGIELYRVKATRTGVYAGISEATWGPDKTETLGGVTITYPEWCEITVYRKVGGESRPFSSGRVRWKETYATAGTDEEGNASEAPNRMWRKRPYGQLEKCAEALALRRAFPETVGAAPTAEEMEGRAIDPTEGVTIDGATGQLVPAPRAKPKAAGEALVPPNPVSPKSAAPEEPAPSESSGDNGPPISGGALRILLKKLQAAGIEHAALCQAFAIETVEALPMAKVNDAYAWVAKQSAA